MITDRSVVVSAKDQVSCGLGGEAVILSLKNGMYYGLSPVGTYVWGALRRPTRVRDIHETLLAEYDVRPQRCEGDLLALLKELLDAGLIEVKDET